MIVAQKHKVLGDDLRVQTRCWLSFCDSKQSGGTHPSSVSPSGPCFRNSQALHGCGRNAPNLVTICAGSDWHACVSWQSFECALHEQMRVLLFSSQWGLNGHQKRRQHPNLSHVWLRKYQSPKHTGRAMLRVVATNPHFEGDKPTLSLPRE